MKKLLFVFLLFMSSSVFAKPDPVLSPDEVKKTLSAEGIKAFDLLLSNENYYGGSVGVAAQPANQAAVEAFNVILKEKPFKAAFLSLVKYGKIGGQLFGLNGLYHTDKTLFEKYVLPYKNSTTTINFESGCDKEKTTVVIKDLIENISQGFDVRLIRVSK